MLYEAANLELLRAQLLEVLSMTNESLTFLVLLPESVNAAFGKGFEEFMDAGRIATVVTDQPHVYRFVNVESRSD